ncbi:AraC family ligand binding domain-containing protein [Mycolicibacterium tusciae]|uniref:AraC family ligand binding domain-containing protein n=1 Tax=Mycolicibacterium tusciae TaxID=75922 RepID=UPI00024A432D|nr:AraC family ligand binding domain-containing protein [Mycolicibacterium tusciae]
MDFVELPRGDLDGDEHGSHGVEMCQLARMTAGAELRVHIAWCGPGGQLGRHRAGMHQLFAVVDGSGWVAGESGTRVPITQGQAATWLPGEMHESGSETGMVVAIVASAIPFAHPTS